MPLQLLVVECEPGRPGALLLPPKMEPAAAERMHAHMRAPAVAAAAQGAAEASAEMGNAGRATASFLGKWIPNWAGQPRADEPPSTFASPPRIPQDAERYPDPATEDDGSCDGPNCRWLNELD